jgi:serine/threonine protein kinase
MYETATSKHPYPGGGGLDSMQKNVTVEPKAPSEAAPGISKPADRIILTAMNKDPEKRYQNMDDLLGELSRLSEDDLGG